MYDYVIVGAGSAGCVLAGRLSEDAGASVHLLEAGGPDKQQEAHIPAAFAKLFRGPADWAYDTDAQPNLNNRRLFWPRGKLLGGSSSINAMVYARGNPADFDAWRDLGNDGWGFSDVLPYFKKAEGFTRGTPDLHGTGGPLTISDLRYVNPLSRAFVEAGAEIGLAKNDDFNGATQEGVGIFQVTQKRGGRRSAADAYLKPAMKRPNLTVQTGAQVNRVIFESGRAVSVEYVRDGRREVARAAKEVILSGGAINSPALLMLSGVGPADHLAEMGIAVVKALPGVGQNLRDHLMTIVAYASKQPVSMAGAETVKNIAAYLLFRRGMLTSNVAEAGGFVRTESDLRTPDLELIFGPTYYISHGYANPPGHGFTLGAILQHPKSIGAIRLSSPDPAAVPSIQPNYLADPDDLARLVTGLKLVRRIGQARAFEAYRGDEFVPGPAVQTDEQLASYTRDSAETLYHPVGTCRMGTDENAVVDGQLRVRGVSGLRVVDASVMPTLMTGHANGATIMIAEKAADMIKSGA